MPNVRRRSSRVMLAGVDAVDRDPPAVELVEPHQQVDEGRLAGARSARRSPRCRRLGDEVQVVDERLVGLVAERDVLERDRAAASRGSRMRRDRIGDLLGLVEQLEDPLRRGDRRLEHVDDAGGLDDRERELARVLDERHDVAEASSGPVATRSAADDRDRDVVEVGDEVHRRLDDPGDELGPIARVVELVVLVARTVSIASCWRPKTFTMACPVCISSTCPFSAAGRGPLGDELLLRALGDERS